LVGARGQAAAEITSATALNSLTGAAIPLGLDVLAEDGRFIELGKADIYGGESVRLAAFKKGISFAAVDVAGLMERRSERFARSFAVAWSHVCSGALGRLPTTAYRFAEGRGDPHDGPRHRQARADRARDGTRRRPRGDAAGAVRSNATYLITGGLGALGLSLAEFMAQHGAGAVALAGRTQPSVGASRRIEALRARGVRVKVVELDVAVFHHAGGSAAMYYPMITELPADWELLILDLPDAASGTPRHSPPTYRRWLSASWRMYAPGSTYRSRCSATASLPSSLRKWRGFARAPCATGLGWHLGAHGPGAPGADPAPEPAGRCLAARRDADALRHRAHRG
jgi:hypothetical protein